MFKQLHPSPSGASPRDPGCFCPLRGVSCGIFACCYATRVSMETPPRAGRHFAKASHRKPVGIFFSCIPLVSMQGRGPKGVRRHSSPRSPGGRKEMSRRAPSLASPTSSMLYVFFLHSVFLLGHPSLNVIFPISVFFLTFFKFKDSMLL